MKKVILGLGLGVLLSLNMQSQTINGVPIDQINEEFIQILGTAKLMNPNKVKVTINFGQENKVWSSKDDGHIFLSSGKKKEFNTMIDALNFMHSLGYEYVDAYAVTLGNQNVYHYLLRKVKLLN